MEGDFNIGNYNSTRVGLFLNRREVNKILAQKRKKGCWKPVLRIRSNFFRIRIRGSDFEHSDPDAT